MELKRMIKYLWAFLFVILLAFFGIMAVKGREIHEKVCPEVKTAIVKTVVSEDTKYTCIRRDCVRDGKMYEIYKQKGFFNENTRVKEVEVGTMDIPEDEELVAVVSGISGNSRTYYAVIPDEGLEDGEAVVIVNK